MLRCIFIDVILPKQSNSRISTISLYNENNEVTTKLYWINFKVCFVLYSIFPLVNVPYLNGTLKLLGKIILITTCIFVKIYYFMVIGVTL